MEINANLGNMSDNIGIEKGVRLSDKPLAKLYIAILEYVLWKIELRSKHYLTGEQYYLFSYF